MISPKLFDDIAKKITENLPSGLQSLREDMEQNIRAVLQSQLSKMNLVTREEFDVQCKVLTKTRLELAKLEDQLKALEAQCQSKGGSE